MNFASFSAWGSDISKTGGSSAIWRIYEGNTYPLLRSFLTPLTVAANSTTVTYNGTTSFSGNSASYSVSGASSSANLLGSLSYTAGSKDAGTTTLTPDGLYSTQQGYDISYVAGTLTIDKADATVTANSGTATYNGQTQSISGFTVSGLVGGETASVLTGVSAGGAGKNIGAYATTASGSDSNYNLRFVNGVFVIVPNEPYTVAVVSAHGSTDRGTGSGAQPFVGTIGAGSSAAIPIDLSDGKFSLDTVDGGIRLPSGLPMAR